MLTDCLGNVYEAARVLIFLLLGQSNWGTVTSPFWAPADAETHPRVYMVVQSTTHPAPIVQARNPLHRQDGGVATGAKLAVGPGMAFASAVAAANPDKLVLLVPCARTGTPISSWTKGKVHYNNCLAWAADAAPYGTFAGIIWSQGGADATTQSKADLYDDRLYPLVPDLRADLEALGAPPLVPFIAAPLGELSPELQATLPGAATVDAAINALPANVPVTAVIPPAPLSARPATDIHYYPDYQRLSRGPQLFEALQTLQ